MHDERGDHAGTCPLASTPPNQNITSESDGAPKPTIASTFRPKKWKRSS